MRLRSFVSIFRRIKVDPGIKQFEDCVCVRFGLVRGLEASDLSSRRM